MATRKTANQKQEEQYNVRWREQHYFQQRVRELESLEEVVDFIESGPRSGEPSGEFYGRLGAFLNGYDPQDAADWERQIFAELRQRLRAAKSKAG